MKNYLMHKEKIHIRKTGTLALLLSVFIFGLSTSVLTVHAIPVLTEVEARQAISVESNEIPNWPTGPSVSAQSAILMDADTGAILYAKNVHEKLYPASTTKILTCLIATEECSMDEVVTFSHDAVFDTPRDSSHIAIDVGEELTMEQALSGILIASANECAFAVAEHISGTWQDFAEYMNTRATELGCIDSNFVNPNGLPDDNHYTSSYDLAMIGKAFFANEMLSKISSTHMLHIPPTDKQPDDIIEYSKNQLFTGQSYAYEYLVGSKTGYTAAAKSTLVSCAEKDGMKLICVVMVEDSPAQFADTVSLFDYGFSNFEKVNISQTETKYNIDNSNLFYSDSDVFGSFEPILSLDTSACITLPKTVPFEEVQSVISYEHSDEETNQVAQITYSYADQFIGSVSINLANESENSYSFENGAMQSTEDSKVTGSSKESNTIYINVLKVAGCVVLTASIIILLIIGYSFIKNYQFAPSNRSNRREWRKDRRKQRSNFRVSRHQVRKQVSRQDKKNRKSRKAKKPSRLRDFDYR